MRLDDSYMRERRRVRSLSDSYFGRKFYYHAADGQLLVLTVPPADGDACAKTRSQDASARQSQSAASGQPSWRPELTAVSASDECPRFLGSGLPHGRGGVRGSLRYRARLSRRHQSWLGERQRKNLFGGRG
jgi:hypothetical protein